MIFNIQVSRSNEVFSFNTDKLPAQSVAYLVEYGLKQSINDAHAGVTKEKFPKESDMLAEVRKRSRARRDQIVTGQLRSGSAVDPLRVAQAETELTDEEILAAMKAAAAAKKSKAA